MKEIRPVATLIADEADLTRYQPGYDAENRRIPRPHYVVTSLIPPIRKHTFAPEVDPAGLIDDEAEFEALSGIDWSSSTFQDREQDGGAERDDLEASGQQRNRSVGRVIFMLCFVHVFGAQYC